MNCPKCSTSLSVWPLKKKRTCTECGAKLKARNLGRAEIVGFVVWCVVVSPLALLFSLALVGSYSPLGLILDGVIGFLVFRAIVGNMAKYEVVKNAT